MSPSKRVVTAVLVCFILLSGCSKYEGKSGHKNTKGAIGVELPYVTEEERLYLQEILEQGGFRAATVLYRGAYTLDEDGKAGGFTYRMLKALEDTYGIPVVTEIVDFDDLFRHNGSAPPDPAGYPDSIHSPDLLKRVDIYAFDLTAVGWREKWMTVVPIMPTRPLLVGRRGEEARYFGALQKKSIVVYKNSSLEVFLRETAERLGISLSILSVPFGEDCLRYVSEGRADFAALEAQDVLLAISDYPDLNTVMPLTEIKMNGWGVGKDNPLLASLLTKFFVYAEKTGILGDATMEGYGISPETYYALLGYPEQAPLSLSREDEEYLLRKKEDGGLTAAIHNECGVYQRRGDGRAEGFHYYLALEIAQVLGLPISFHPVLFPDFFRIVGESPEGPGTGSDSPDTPELLSEVDFYIGTFSPLPRRKEFLDFIELYPTKLVYVMRQDYPKERLDNLRGQRVALVGETSYEEWLMNHYGRNELVFAEVERGDDIFAAISSGDADISICDVDLALARMRGYPDLSIHPADQEADILCWAVARGDTRLRGLLEKVVDHIRYNGTFDTLWQACFGISFTEYLNFVAQ